MPKMGTAEHDRVYREVGARIRDLRQALSLTRAAFAERVGTSDDSVRDWENGTTGPKLDNLHQIAVAFDLDCNWLVRGNGIAPLAIRRRFLFDPAKMTLEIGVGRGMVDVLCDPCAVQQFVRLLKRCRFVVTQKAAVEAFGSGGG